jgi:hypothetical protein
MAASDLEQSKVCPKCNLAKEISNFRARTDNGKRRNHCNQCWSERCKRYNANRDPEARKAFNRAYYHRKIKTSPEYAARIRNAKVAKLYGLSAAEYAALKLRFKNRCGICGAQPEKGRNLAVDHCHRTNVVRGLLCRPCNMGLGKLGDSIEGLERAIAYLRSDWRQDLDIAA